MRERRGTRRGRRWYRHYLLDRLTPVSHSRRMAQALPDAELVVVPGAGHSVNVTRQEVVDGALLRLLERVQQRQAA